MIAGFLFAVPLAHVFIGVTVVMQKLQVAQAFQSPDIHLHRDVQKPRRLARRWYASLSQLSCMDIDI